jgi:hypothetical protein
MFSAAHESVAAALLPLRMFTGNAALAFGRAILGNTDARLKAGATTSAQEFCHARGPWQTPFAAPD